MAPPLPPSAARGLLLLLAVLAATRPGRGVGGPPLPGGGMVGGGGVQKRSVCWLGWFWGHCPCVRVTGPTSSARNVRIRRRGSDPKAGAVTRKARQGGESGALSGQGVTWSCRNAPFAPVLVYEECPRVPKVTPVRPKSGCRTVSPPPSPRDPQPGNGARPRPGPPLLLARERSEQQQQATGGGGRQRWRHVSHLQLPQTAGYAVPPPPLTPPSNPSPSIRIAFPRMIL
jgi:hypothetical protein